MVHNIIKKIRFIPLWKEEKELKWLSDMSKNGWHLTKKDYITYWFEQGDIKDYSYIYDYKMTADSDFDEYKSIYHDSGWEYIDGYGGWHYFRANSDGQVSEIYNNVESKQRRLKRLLTILMIIGCSNLAIILYNIIVFSIIFDSFSSIPFVILAMWGISILVIILLGYTSIRIGLRLRKLNKSIYE